MTYNHIMVDMETTGTSPESTAMIQLAGVRFNLETQDVDPVFFDECLSIPGNRRWDQDTLEWWGTMPELLSSILGRARDPKTVLEEFHQWAGRDLDVQPILWAKPTHFEFPFIESYNKQFGLPSLFHYRFAENLLTHCRAKGFPELDAELEFEGEAHNAIHDVLHQVKVLFEANNRSAA